jgi:hypothetical protein
LPIAKHKVVEQKSKADTDALTLATLIPLTCASHKFGVLDYQFQFNKGCMSMEFENETHKIVKVLPPVLKHK